MYNRVDHNEKKKMHNIDSHSSFGSKKKKKCFCFFNVYVLYVKFEKSPVFALIMKHLKYRYSRLLDITYLSLFHLI